MKAIGFIGAGNMASAIASGIVSAQPLDYQLLVYDIAKDKTDAFASLYDAKTITSPQEIVKQSDIVILAIKPNVFTQVLPEIKNDIADKLIISIAAGKTLAFIEDLLGKEAHLVRVMPNINAKVQAAMSAYCFNQLVTNEEIKHIESIFSSIGKVIHLDESFFPVFGVLAGSAPAFSYLFIDALATAAVKHGLPKTIALDIAAQTVLGSAKLILESKQSPRSLIDEVCSPGGTTIEGMQALQEHGMEKAINHAINAAVEKDKKL